jgi:tRNA 2-selenouridine synthase
MRSAGMAWLFRTSGIQCHTLDKGYKAFRRHVLEFLEGDFPFVVLGGLTGSGKTDLLHELEEQGQQILDLERLASHKGSAFGGIGKGPQATNEQFENDLFWALSSMNRNNHVWTEDESRTIGRNTLPGGIYRNIRKAPLIFLDVPLEKRLDRLVSDYACFPAGELIRAIEKIRPRLGGKSATLAIEGVREKNYRQTAAIVLKYYDKTYLYGLAKRDKSRVLEFKESEQAEVSGLASGLLEFAKENLPKEPKL